MAQVSRKHEANYQPTEDTRNPPTRTNGSSFPVYTEQKP